MVYCDKCGTQNEEGSEYCRKCGASLKGGPQFRPVSRSKDDCFGIDLRPNPYVGAIIGLLIGSILIVLGLGQALGFEVERYIGPIIMIVIGLLIVIAALLGYLRRSGR